MSFLDVVLTFLGQVVLVLLLIFTLYKLIDKVVRLPYIPRDASQGYHDRYVLITGASRGLGYEAVLRLDRLGCHVFAGVRSEESASKLRDACSSRVIPVILDVCNDDSVRAAFEFVSARLKKDGQGLWGLINNAGIAGFGRIEWLRVPDYERVMRTNVFGLVDVTMTFLPLLKASRGRVINVSSAAGRNAQWFIAHYNMSKYAVEAFSDSLRRSLRAYGVKVLLIEPGLFKTDLASVDQTMEAVKALWDNTTPEIREEFGVNYLEDMKAASERIFMTASDRISDVIDTYEHALLARWPRHRYVIGFGVKYIMIPLQTLPEWISDFVLEKFIRPPATPAALKKKKKRKEM